MSKLLLPKVCPKYAQRGRRAKVRRGPVFVSYLWYLGKYFLHVYHIERHILMRNPLTHTSWTFRTYVSNCPDSDILMREFVDFILTIILSSEYLEPPWFSISPTRNILTSCMKYLPVRHFRINVIKRVSSAQFIWSFYDWVQPLLIWNRFESLEQQD